MPRFVLLLVVLISWNGMGSGWAQRFERERRPAPAPDYEPYYGMPLIQIPATGHQVYTECITGELLVDCVAIITSNSWPKFVDRIHRPAVFRMWQSAADGHELTAVRPEQRCSVLRGAVRQGRGRRLVALLLRRSGDWRRARRYRVFRLVVQQPHRLRTGYVRTPLNSRNMWLGLGKTGIRLNIRYCTVQH